MIEISLDRFVELTGLSRATVYNRLKENKLKGIKDDNGRLYIQLDVSIDDLRDSEQYKENSLEDVQNLIGGFISEYRNVMNKLEDSYKKQVSDKDEQINELKAEIKRLREKSFFKKLFGD